MSSHQYVTVRRTRTGDHVIKTGAQIKILRSDSVFDSNSGHVDVLEQRRLPVRRADALHAEPRDNELARPNELYGFFAQDDWRPTRDLTLNLCRRYDYESAQTQALVAVTGEPGPGNCQLSAISFRLSAFSRAFRISVERFPD